MLNFNSILLFSENPKALAEFYQQVFQKEPDMSEESYTGFLAGTTFLSIGHHDKVRGKNQNPERMMLNFETKDVAGEFARIKQLDAKVIAEPNEENYMIATFEDPDGNYFQLVPPWEDAKK